MNYEFDPNLCAYLGKLFRPRSLGYSYHKIHTAFKCETHNTKKKPHLGTIAISTISVQSKGVFLMMFMQMHMRMRMRMRDDSGYLFFFNALFLEGLSPHPVLKGHVGGLLNILF